MDIRLAWWCDSNGDYPMNLMQRYDKYTFFWSNGSIYSNWHLAPITIDGITYNCCEQYMMAKKAKLFGDMVTWQSVMETPLPREQKALGRQVKNFNPDIWAVIARDVVFRANMAKFTQHNELESAIFETRHTLLVEASPYDTVWGIGMSEEDAIRVGVAHWRGTNWLGQVITEVRESIFGE